MRAPKILPWVAHKDGISEQLALHLWRRAAGESEELTGCCDSSDYYLIAVRRFLDLSEEEGERQLGREPLPGLLIVPRINWLLRPRASHPINRKKSSPTPPTCFPVCPSLWAW